MQAGVLDREKIRRRARFVVMAVPQPRGRHEGAPGLPVDPRRVDDGAVGADLGADQRVAPRVAMHDEIQRDALMAMGPLHVALGQDPEHGPQRVCRRQGLVVAGVSEQHGHSAAPGGVGISGHLGQPGSGLLAIETCRCEARSCRVDTEIAEQG